ncbi:sensor c-di-GMP phosphodiesterase-like protein [Variovorax boronicumulans]|uniref:cyclic-guanylate-specific phosphodiesterase n=1 Tax=Variovorax boronicumulans TaxID=436515 RepID=A0AAW8D4A8_9BURK|nr:EAL domain-containing protein [Variovorax boronicumulans]MDP9894858.1 sensor c-di-GMP phosphodiesterase-like protein [Variovorax boronicumulans]MDQ0038566.1 sensor c-di-GMP phosphodiesterase-like protein [Variovorax boronicumulans]MDQ0054822.1 sensor c-di-GMP phosphodiesterase-like protein [Variovorax boronicumulans]
MLPKNFLQDGSAASRRDSDPEAKALGQLIAKRKMIVLWSTLSVMITLAGGAAVINVAEQEKIRSAAAAVIAKPLERVTEINLAFQELQALEVQPCTMQHLEALRSIAFRSAIIRDVIYRDQGVLCSANLGTAASALPSQNPDFATEGGRQIWRNVDLSLAPGVKSTLVKEGRYGLLIAPEDPGAVSSGHYALSVVLLNRNHRTMLVIRGADPGIDRSPLVSGSTYWLRGDLISVACLTGQTTCYILKTNWGAVLLANAILLLVAGILACACTVAGIALCLARKFRSRTIDAMFREAVRHEELFMHYQPVVDNRTGAVVSAEALMRWTLRSGKVISPAIFIPIAEENDLIGNLTCLALQRVSEDLGSFLLRHADFKVSVNVVPADMVDSRFHLALRRNFEERGIAPAQLSFELTERTSAKLESAMAVLLDLGRRGHEIYIDDFGTGYANLSYLSDLKVDKIKLDKKFTDTVGTGTLRERIVPSVIDLARELGVQIIVEGVENAEQVNYFRSHGVHLMQGWFYAPALPAAELIGALEGTAATPEREPSTRQLSLA